MLEIGCGWGALAEAAARDFGATVTGVTLSREQLDWGRQRLARAGLAGDLRFQDYRDIDDGPYDAIVSIEMFEAVGRDYWPGYFDAVSRQLKPGGRACIQSITIRDDLFERYLRSTDFIQQYIFPGGLLPSRSEFRAAAARAGLEVVDELDFGADYARTLGHWRTAFLRAGCAVRRLGFDTRFMRTWDFYLVYCQAAFETRQHRCHAVHAAARMTQHRAVMAAPAPWRRRALLLAALALPLPAGLAAAAAVPPELRELLPQARLQGSGRLRHFGLHIYDARLWVGAGFDPARHADMPLALELDYARSLDGAQIARTLDRRDAPPRRTGRRHGGQLAGCPAAHRARREGRSAHHRHPAARVGCAVPARRPAPRRIRDAEFARRFFAIWLSPRTSEPQLRRELLGSDR